MAWPLVYDLDSSKFDKGVKSRSERPTIALVHDAFHTSFHFEGLVRELRGAAYNVLTPQLPSSTSSMQTNAFQADVQAVYDDCRPAIEAGRNIVLVLHGYSGLLAVTAERLNRYALSRPRAGYVVKIVFIAALVANEGECFLDLFRPDWLIHENGIFTVRRPDQVFFHDCPPEIARSAVAMMRPQLADTFRFRLTDVEWKQIPCVYVLCESDQAVSQSVQRACLRKLQTPNRQTRSLSIHAGHAPYLSKTKDTAALLVRVSGGI